MRLTFFGSSLVSAYWNGAATYYRGLLRALAARGHEIVFCEPDAYERQQNRDLERDPEWARVIVYRAEEERDALVDDALGSSDWVVKCSGVGLWDAELEERIATGGGRARTAFWDVDAPATLAAMRAGPFERLRALIPRFDRIFTYGGGPPVVEAYREVGARSCAPIYNGLDPELHRPVERPVAPRWDVLFMGNRLPDRDERVVEFLIRPAGRLPQAHFALGGSGWDDVELPANVERLGHVPVQQHNEVNAAARLVLNVHRAPMIANGWSPATRMFEAAGAEACQITDAWEGIEDFFEPGHEVLVAHDGDDVVRLVQRVSEQEARRIGRAARSRALRDHTYERRADLVHRMLGTAGGRATRGPSTPLEVLP